MGTLLTKTCLVRLTRACIVILPSFSWSSIGGVENSGNVDSYQMINQESFEVT